MNNENENIDSSIDFNQVRVAGIADVSCLARITFANETVTKSRMLVTKSRPDLIAGSANSNARSRGLKDVLTLAPSPATPALVIRARNEIVPQSVSRI